jgi:C4-type Zn-finger protein
MMEEHDARERRHPDAKVIGEPSVVEKIPRSADAGRCRKCGQLDLDLMTVHVEDPYLVGGQGAGAFLQCPQCGWKSEMVTIAE